MNTVTSPDGTTIAYGQSGEGPPLILVGGFHEVPPELLAPVLQSFFTS
jgi:hypothetical protein